MASKPTKSKKPQPAKKAAKPEGNVIPFDAPEPVKPIDIPGLPELVESASVEIKNLVLDAGTQPRFSLNEDKIAEYKELIAESKKTGAVNPFGVPEHAVEVIRTPEGKLYLWSGFHRVFAHKAAGEKEVFANIREGTLDAAIILSLGTNATHGVARTSKDKTFTVKKALAIPGIAAHSDVKIAALCGVSTFLVAQNRTLANSPAVRKAVRAGKEISVNTSKIGKPKKAAKAGAEATPKEKDKPAKTPIEECWREITKIKNGITSESGKDEAEKFEKGLTSGAVALNVKQVRAFAGLSEKTIGKIWPLVKAGQDPWKAYEFSKSELAEKVIADLHNRCLANGGNFEHKSGGFTITVTKNK